MTNVTNLNILSARSADKGSSINKTTSNSLIKQTHEYNIL